MGDPPSPPELAALLDDELLLPDELLLLVTALLETAAPPAPLELALELDELLAEEELLEEDELLLEDEEEDELLELPLATHAPSWQVPPVHAVPFATLVGVGQLPVAESQGPGIWQAGAVHIFCVPPPQAPPVQVAPTAHRSPPLQEVPSAFEGFVHTPFVHVPAVVQSSAARQVTPKQPASDPTHACPLHTSPKAQAAPQLIVLPQPSGISPQVTPVGHEVMGVQPSGRGTTGSSFSVRSVRSVRA